MDLSVTYTVFGCNFNNIRLFICSSLP